MKKTNKKGFTIVELVVVIAIIAVLAAVLIPTFSSVIKKANQSADQQAVTNMNKILLTEEKPADVDGVVAILVANEYAGDLTTYYDKYQLAWISDKNVVVLVEDGKVVYPENYEGAEGYELIRPMAKDAATLVDGLEAGRVVYVGDDVKVDDFHTEDVGRYAVDLNGHIVTTTGNVGSWTAENELVVSNGTINSDNEKIAVIAENGGKVELKNVQVYSAAGSNPLQSYGGTMVLNNVTTAQNGVAEKAYYNTAIQIANHLSKNEEGKYYFDGVLSEITVNGGMYSGDKAIQMSAPGGTIIINDGTFIGASAVINADYNAGYASQGATYVIEINGGSFTGAVKINNANISCVVNGGTFSVDIENTANVTIGEGKTVVNNNNGTWTVK